jgi:hypothetical protein
MPTLCTETHDSLLKAETDPLPSRSHNCQQNTSLSTAPFPEDTSLG